MRDGIHTARMPRRSGSALLDWKSLDTLTEAPLFFCGLILFFTCLWLEIGSLADSRSRNFRRKHLQRNVF